MNSLSMKKAQQGFTLIELMIVVAIIGILASIAMPAYTTYTKKSKFTEVVLATSAVKLAIELCVQDGSCFVSGATAPSSVAFGTLGLPAAAPLPSGAYQSMTVSAAGVILSTGNTAVDGLTYQLTPTVDAQQHTTWSKAGTCVAAGLC